MPELTPTLALSRSTRCAGISGSRGPGILLDQQSQVDPVLELDDLLFRGLLAPIVDDNYLEPIARVVEFCERLQQSRELLAGTRIRGNDYGKLRQLPTHGLAPLLKSKASIAKVSARWCV